MDIEGARCLSAPTDTHDSCVPITGGVSIGKFPSAPVYYRFVVLAYSIKTASAAEISAAFLFFCHIKIINKLMETNI